MSELKSLQNKKLKTKLKLYLKNKNIQDIFLVGSCLKNKLVSNDIDIFILFKLKNLDDVSCVLYEMNESLREFGKVHLEPVYLEELLESSLLFTVLREGFSIKQDKFVFEKLKKESYTIFSFKLDNLSKVDKVRFAQALYGRKKDGIFYKEKAVVLGSGSFMVDTLKEEIFKELFVEWKIKFRARTALVDN